MMTWCVHCGEDIEYQADGYWVHVPNGSYRSTGIACDSSRDGLHHPHRTN